MDILKGDIFYIAKSNYNNVGSEQNPGRPAVIVSNNEANRFSRNVSVVYLTTQEKKPLPTHCEVVAREKSTALCEGVTTIAKERLLDFVKACTKEEMESIDECLAIALGLDVADTTDVYEDIAHELKAELEVQAKKAELFKKECEEAQTLCSKVIQQNESLIDENNALKAELKVPKRFSDDNVIRLEVERDLYKAQYEQLLERMLTK